MTAIPHFHFITLFPETIRVWLTTSILGRAHAANLFAFDLYQLRDFSKDKHRSVDDAAYGGGGGMVLRIEPLVEAVETIRDRLKDEKATVIYFSPAGRRLSTELITELKPTEETKHFLFVCGHYEGVDQRFLDHWVDLEISLGDFVLTGGELPAVALADAMIRQREGALGAQSANETESFSLRDPQTGGALLEYPHYTRPAEFRGHMVPEILMSGNHEKVALWRERLAREKTASKRPDLLPRPRP